MSFHLSSRQHHRDYGHQYHHHDHRDYHKHCSSTGRTMSTTATTPKSLTLSGIPSARLRLLAYQNYLYHSLSFSSMEWHGMAQMRLVAMSWSVSSICSDVPKSSSPILLEIVLIASWKVWSAGSFMDRITYSLHYIVMIFHSLLHHIEIYQNQVDSNIFKYINSSHHEFCGSTNMFASWGDHRHLEAEAAAFPSRGSPVASFHMFHFVLESLIQCRKLLTLTQSLES